MTGTVPSIAEAEAALAARIPRAKVIEIWNSVSQSGLTLDDTIYRFAALIHYVARRDRGKQ